MDAHTRKVYVPMTETGFYILFCLQKPNHGYGIVQTVEKLTNGEIRLAPGTMYGSLSKMEKDGLIRFVSEEDKRKIYVITELGTEVLELELKRIKRLYRKSVPAPTRIFSGSTSIPRKSRKWAAMARRSAKIPRFGMGSSRFSRRSSITFRCRLLQTEKGKSVEALTVRSIFHSGLFSGAVFSGTQVRFFL